MSKEGWLLTLLKALDGILDEIEGVEDLDFGNGLTGSCEDYFLDIDLAQEVSNLTHGPSGGSNCVVGMSEASTITTAPDSRRRRIKRMLLYWPEILSNGEKRRRKPPRRYIEESSRADSKHRLKQESIVAKHKPHLWREPKKKHTGLLESESEHSSSASESETEVPEKISSKSIDRRKNQRMWTVQEVIKLVDGICQLGVGHWSDIKRLSFASSTYRTPIDLRNKWRNLLRASRAEKLEKGEAEHKEKSAVRPLPRSLLRRVRELEAVHPYPRKTKTRCSFFPKSS
ncbi:hypothetical protein SAY86_027178 [Trapa natans]|uniref:Uncharacterized protein n=1 Tax=Trapa natans TaxID=22666 RepID=A0AAN7KQR6_TRANT|nr:hypothetical protein SAY86_027178 [Trapa natans]